MLRNHKVLNFLSRVYWIYCLDSEFIFYWFCINFYSVKLKATRVCCSTVLQMRSPVVWTDVKLQLCLNSLRLASYQKTLGRIWFQALQTADRIQFLGWRLRSPFPRWSEVCRATIYAYHFPCLIDPSIHLQNQWQWAYTILAGASTICFIFPPLPVLLSSLSMGSYTGLA